MHFYPLQSSAMQPDAVIATPAVPPKPAPTLPNSRAEPADTVAAFPITAIVIPVDAAAAPIIDVPPVNGAAIIPAPQTKATLTPSAAPPMVHFAAFEIEHSAAAGVADKARIVSTAKTLNFKIFILFFNIPTPI